MNNSSPATALQFVVAGTVAGASVTVYADGVPIGSGTASGTSTTVTTNGTTSLADNGHVITAVQTEPGKSASPASPPLTINIDTVPPQPTITSVTPNPRTTSLAQMTISFSESVSGFDLSDLRLTRNGGANLLPGSQTVSSADGGVTWTLGNLTSLTSLGGNYELDVLTSGTPGIDTAGNAYTNTPSTTFTIDLSAPVVDLNGPASGTGYTVNWSNVGGVNVADPANATVSDSDSANLTQMSVAIVTPHAGDTLSANNSGFPSIHLSFGAGTLTMSGADSVADYQAVLRTVKYDNTNGGPGVGSVTVAVVASDGQLTGAEADATVNIVLGGPPPAIDLNGAASGTSFTATWNGSTPVKIADPTATIVDTASPNLNSLVVALSANHGGDLLAANNSAAPNIQLTFSAGTLTLSGSDTVANYQAVLRSVTYTNTGGGPGTDSLSINVTATDPLASSNTAVATVQIPPRRQVGQLAGQLVQQRPGANRKPHRGFP